MARLSRPPGRRDPHDVLGVARDAAFATVKAAWRRLAREHHPDLTAGDIPATRAATRRMAEINAAYEALRRADAEARAGVQGAAAAAGRSGGTDSAQAGASTTGRRPSGPPRPRPTRPVTGRLDTSGTFRPRNATTGPRARVAAHPPVRLGRLGRVDHVDREPPRASDPTGPLERGRLRRFRRPRPPTLDAAKGFEIDFGKFHGHTLGEIAAFEPSYIDWLARTISRDPALVAAARVLQDDLDRRGVARRSHPEMTSTGRSA